MLWLYFMCHLRSLALPPHKWQISDHVVVEWPLIFSFTYKRVRSILKLHFSCPWVFTKRSTAYQWVMVFFPNHDGNEWFGKPHKFQLIRTILILIDKRCLNIVWMSFNFLRIYEILLDFYFKLRFLINKKVLFFKKYELGQVSK